MKQNYIFSTSVWATLIFCMLTTTLLAQKPDSKISRDLHDISTMTSRAKAADPQFQYFEIPDIFQVRGEYVAIEAIAEKDGKSLMIQLERLGLIQGSSYGRVVNGMFPMKKIDNMESMSNLMYVRPAYKPVNNVGLVTSQGDLSQYSDIARDNIGVNGAGQKVGVLSDSYDALGGASAGISSGDLPGTGNPLGFNTPVEVLLDLDPGEGSDEGRGMMEIVHDVAPGAELAFHTAFGGQAVFANGIKALADVGSNVIVDDIIYFAEPMFQDGIIAQATDEVTAQGATYLSSAGNGERQSYESAFNPAFQQLITPISIVDFQPVFSATYELHDFDSGPGVDVFQEVLLSPGTGFTFTFQWDQPFASVCEGCPGSASDLDIFIALDESFDFIIAEFSGVNINQGLDAVELAGVGLSPNATGPLPIYVAIGQFIDTPNPGPTPGLIKFVSFGEASNPIEYLNFKSTLFGHANSRSSIATGGVRYTNTPSFGSAVPILETGFVSGGSAAGGTPIFFDTSGNRINELRPKPEICAPQGANTTFFGSDFEGDGFPNFFGTSASAPHAAGAAALLLDATGEHFTPGEVKTVFNETAEDMDDPFTAEFDAGFDFGTGNGFLQVDAALAKVQTRPSVFRFNSFTNDQNGANAHSIIRDTLIIFLPSASDDGSLPEFNIEAKASPGQSKLESVRFKLRGPRNLNRVENEPPYTLFGDRKGDLNFAFLEPGIYTLTATPYARNKGRGRPGISKSVTISVSTANLVEGFTLVNAETDEDIGELGDVIDLSALPTQAINIRANVGVAHVRNVKFRLSGQQHFVNVERKEPYALFGDFRGNYFSWRYPGPHPGKYELEVTVAYQLGHRFVRETIIKEFEVIDGTTAPTTVAYQSPSPRSLNLSDHLSIYPNPSEGEVQVEWMSQENLPAELTVYTALGQAIHKVKSDQDFTTQLNLERYGKGVYFAKIVSGEKIVTKRFMIK